MRSCILLLLFCLTCSAFGQQPAAKPAPERPDAQELVTKEMGQSFTVVKGYKPLFGDLDNDGQEDMVIVVASESPLVDEVEYKYQTVDPYSAYWGWGTPKDTLQFAATSAGPPRYIAILHNWRAPKAKFLVINLPFEKLVLSRVMLKKKPILSLHTIESSSLESDLFWDGKKYKWNPGYTN